MVFINANFDFKFEEGTSEEIMQETLNKTMLMMKNEAIILSPADTTELRQKIQLVEINPNEYNLESLAPYSEPMEFGTVPFYAPIEPLKEWAGRKLGDEDIAYAVRAKIAKKGVSAHPFMRPALDITKETHLPNIARQVYLKYK